MRRPNSKVNTSRGTSPRRLDNSRSSRKRLSMIPQKRILHRAIRTKKRIRPDSAGLPRDEVPRRARPFCRASSFFLPGERLVPLASKNVKVVGTLSGYTIQIETVEVQVDRELSSSRLTGRKLGPISEKQTPRSGESSLPTDKPMS
jgi:hypothetical protein